MKAELLSPAGSWEGMKAAFLAGADAVYIGGKNFGARAYANNLEDGRMAEAIDYAHIHEKKLYLTVNTLLKDAELESSLFQYLAPLYERGLDAVIVQDLGVLSFIRANFPLLPIHASTQMAVTGARGAAYLRDLGVTRVVTARELSLKEIQVIHDTAGVEIESFIHGALCYSYSGMCLFSSILGGRSGNRGRCAQPCRLPYDVYENGKRLNSKEDKYLLSPKDMCTIELLPELLRGGVYSLKIEGRMKKPEYAAGVTRIYRKYLDMALTSPETFSVAGEDYRELAALYQRDGFNRGYYQVHNGKEMMAVKNQKLTEKKGCQREEKARVLYEKLAREYVGKSSPVGIEGSLYLKAGEPARFTLKCRDASVSVSGEPAQQAVKQPLSEERIKAQLRKTGATPFSFENPGIMMEGELFLPMQSLNELRRRGLEELEKELLKVYRRKPPVPAGREPEKRGGGAHKLPLYISVETREQLSETLKWKDVAGIYVDCSMTAGNSLFAGAEKLLREVHNGGKECYLSLPYIVRGDTLEKEKNTLRELADAGIDGFLVRNLESWALLKKLGLERKAVLDYVLYSFNNRAESFWELEGVKRQTLPLELNERELQRRYNGGSEMIIYGRYPMMISAQCLKKTAGKCSGRDSRAELADRYGQRFPVKCYCSFCYNVIYNSIPTGLLKESQSVKNLGPESLRMVFTTENAKETGEMIALFAGVYLHHQKNPQNVPEFTKGHFKRGVE